MTVLIVCLSPPCGSLNSTSLITEFHKSVYSNSHLVRIPASCCHRDTPASKPQVYMSAKPVENDKELYGPLGVLHKDTVGLRLVSHLQTVERGCGRNLWKCQLFSYLRCMYSMKMWQMYCRTGIKMSRWNRVSDLSNIYYNSSQIWHLLPPTGCFVYHVREYYEHIYRHICTKILNELYYELKQMFLTNIFLVCMAVMYDVV